MRTVLIPQDLGFQRPCHCRHLSWALLCATTGRVFFPRTGAGQNRAGLTDFLKTMVVSDGANRCSLENCLFSTPPTPLPCHCLSRTLFRSWPSMCGHTSSLRIVTPASVLATSTLRMHSKANTHALHRRIVRRHRQGVIQGESRPKRGASPQTQPIIPLGEHDRDQWLPSGGEDQAAVREPCTSIFA